MSEPHSTDQTEPTQNRLAAEKSPYLRQHAGNPVDWYPWGEEAFAEARRRDVPIFLSIGYATCHWCHVMERESFEEEQTAAVMNRLFVNVKVDREERPDVDAMYMAAAQAMTGQGGWPLSVWLTPQELRPFYAGTYFPPVGRYGRPGFRELLAALSQAWEHDRARVEESAAQITEAIRGGMAISSDLGAAGSSGSDLEQSVADLSATALSRLSTAFDPEHGGFGPAPKFPRPSLLFFLLDAASARLDLPVSPTGLRDMVERTLHGIALGGIHDHLGGGFARYAVDSVWRVPHFEKMLYDQGQLLEAFARLYEERPSPLLSARIRTTISYLQTDLDAGNGLFHAAEDADSEGEEGTFYVWRREEIDAILNDTEAALFRRRYEVSDEGNFEDRKNVLHTAASIDELVEEFDLDRLEVERRLAEASAKLLAVRLERPRPLLDTKIITSWNGLLLSGLAWSSRVLDDDEIYDLAVRLAEGLIETMWEGEDLMRRMIDGELRYRGYLEDYAHLLKGLIDLWDVRQDVRFLTEAHRVAERAIELFADDEGYGFYMTDDREQDLPVRTRSDHDGAEPSGTSVMVWSLARLGRLLDVEEYRERASSTILAYAGRIREYPDVMPMLLAGGLQLVAVPRSTVVVASSDDPEGFRRLLLQARDLREPWEDLIAVGPEPPAPFLLDHLPYLSQMKPLDGRSVAFRCENFTCGLPMTDLTNREDARG